jgi:hypothetical protein
MFPWFSSRHFVKLLASASHDGAPHELFDADWAWTGSAAAAGASADDEPPNWIAPLVSTTSCRSNPAGWKNIWTGRKKNSPFR